MDIRQIRYFVAVAESKSLTKAVERLSVEQPALSVNIKRLEEELGSQLFHRSPRGMELTHAGNEFLNHSYGILRQVASAVRSVHDIEQNPQGSVAVAMPPSLSHVLTWPLYKYVRENYPDIELDLEEGLKGMLVRGFELGQFDILVHFDVQPTGSWDVSPLFIENLHLVNPIVSMDNNGNSDIPFRDLADHKIVLPSTRNSLGVLLNEAARKMGIELQGLNVRSAYHQTLLLMKTGAASAILPTSAIHDLRNDFVTARKIVEPEIVREAAIITHLDRPQSYAIRTVVEAIRKIVEELWKSGVWEGKLPASTSTDVGDEAAQDKNSKPQEE